MNRAAMRVLGALLSVLASSSAAAQETAPSPSREVLFGLRGVGEVWQDTSIITNYRSSRFAGAGFFGVGLTDWLMLDAEVGHMRQEADVSRSGVAAGSLQLVPVTVALEARRDSSRAEVFGGAGFTAVTYTESTVVGVVSGTKPALDLRAGARVHTSLARPPITGPTTPGVRGLDVELLVGRRQHHAFGLGTGFDLSAWRVGLGLVARL